VPVTAANKRNILDPATALIMAVPEGQPLVGPAACNRTIPVYDGYVRFDVTLHYVGVRDVAVDGYSGPVSVCAARYTPVSGHKRDSKSTKFMAENRDIEAWLAPIARAHVVVPFHIAMMTCRHRCHRRSRIFGRAFGPDGDHHALMARQRGIS